MHTTRVKGAIDFYAWKLALAEEGMRYAMGSKVPNILTNPALQWAGLMIEMWKLRHHNSFVLLITDIIDHTFNHLSSQQQYP